MSVSILGCRCGDDRCSQYIVKITETENSVIWDDYFAIRDKQSNYFHFEFEKKQYFKEVEKLMKLSLRIGRFDGLPIKTVNDFKKKHIEIELSDAELQIAEYKMEYELESADYFEEQFYGQKKHFKFY